MPMTWHSVQIHLRDLQLNGMFEYCKKWIMIVSLMKTKVLVFNNIDVMKCLQWEATLLRLLMNISILVLFSTQA